MKRIHWQLCLIVVVLGLLALALPGTAAAAPIQSSALNSVVVDAPTQPTFALPGVFSLTFGQTAGSAEVDLPSLNAVATVDGLAFSPQVGWDSISLKQKQPATTSAGTISEAQITISGATQGYGTVGTAQVDLKPSSALQAKGQVGFAYDAMNKRSGFSLQNFDVALNANTVNVAVKGMTTGDNALSFDTANVAMPATGAMVSVTGYQVKNGRANWDSLTLAQDSKVKVNLGNVGSLSNMQVSVAGPNAGYATMISTNFGFQVGQVVQADGKVYGIINSPNKQNGVALSNANLAVQMSGLNLQMSGINSINSGVKIDTVTLAAKPLSVDAEMKGVVVGGTSGFNFDAAKLTYAPSGANSLSVMLEKSPQGYVVTTTTVIPIAAK